MWNTVTDHERIALWKNLRESLGGLPLDKILEAVSKFFANIPFGTRTLDYYSPHEWPTPWEILYRRSFCTSSISLLMYYTITIVSPTVKVELYLVEDDTDTYLLPVIDNHFVLNYELGSVNMYTDICDRFSIKHKFDKTTIKSIL